LQAQLFQVQKLEALGTLASGIAHDFNNLLTVMVSFSELAKEAMPAETEAAENLEQVLKASHQAKELVEQILTFSRPSPQARQPVRLQDIVTETLSFLRRVFPRTIDIQADLDKTASVALLDAAQMRQVIMNLGVNACQAMADDSGTLEVRLGETVIEDSAIQAHPALKPGSYLQLTVRDTGCGMSDQV
jgi:signal transduction histidine kinase